MQFIYSPKILWAVFFSSVHLCRTLLLSEEGPPKQTWCCFHQRPAYDIVGHLRLWSRPTTSKAFSYPSGLTDGSRWILVSSTRWRIRWLPDRYSRHMNCISSRSSSRPSTSLPWEPAVYRNSGSPGQQVDVERRRGRRTDKYAVAVINCPAGTTCW